MTKTHYDPDKGRDSLAAHKEAVKQIYPKIFPGAKLEIDHLNGTTADMEDKIDVLVRVFINSEPAPLVLTIQERWRKPKYSGFRDLTITKWNTVTSKPAEYYDGKMQYFLYGYFDDLSNRFGDVLFVDYAKMKFQIANGILEQKEEQNNKGEKKQDFACYSFDSLSVSGCILWSSSQLFASPCQVSEFWRQLAISRKTA